MLLFNAWFFSVSLRPLWRMTENRHNPSSRSFRHLGGESITNPRSYCIPTHPPPHAGCPGGDPGSLGVPYPIARLAGSLVVGDSILGLTPQGFMLASAPRTRAIVQLVFLHGAAPSRTSETFHFLNSFANA